MEKQSSISRSREAVSRLMYAFHTDSLFRNSLYLMLATAVMAGFGFFFWLIVSRLYSTTDIGIATTLISIMSLISVLSLIGFNVSFVRYLAKAKNRNIQMNTGFIFVGSTAIALSLIFIAFVQFISPQLIFVQTNIWFALAFVLTCFMNAISTIAESVFLSGRQTKYSLIINTVLSFVKMLIPFAFVGWGAMGIFISAAIAQTFGTLLSLIILIQRFEFRPALAVDWAFVSSIWRYNAANYFSTALSLLPSSIIPIIIINHLGPESSAYYYMAMMIGNLLYAIPYATTRSLFAESSHDEHQLEAHLAKATRVIVLFLTPSILILLLGSEFIMRIFGENYANGASSLLRLIALSGITMSTSALLSTLLQIKKNVRAIIITNATNTVTVIFFSYVFLSLFGLIGVGFALIAGGMLTSAVGYIFYGLSSAQKERIHARLREYFPKNIWWRVKFLYSKIRYGTRATILFYPERPQPFHLVHTLCYESRFAISTNPQRAFDVAIAFEDTTHRTDNKQLTELCQKYPVLNANCTDISKTHVEKVFREIFGYGMAIDPRTHAGVYVRKSDTNAMHDGTILREPTNPLPGYVYQRLINTVCPNGHARDIRVFIYKDEIALVLNRYKDVNDRFDKTIFAERALPSEAFSTEETDKLIRFCQAFNMDYGELDVLRDMDDNGTLYVVDVNNTPSGPRRGVHLNADDYDVVMATLKAAFEKHFLSKKNTLSTTLTV